MMRSMYQKSDKMEKCPTSGFPLQQIKSFLLASPFSQHCWVFSTLVFKSFCIAAKFRYERNGKGSVSISNLIAQFSSERLSNISDWDMVNEYTWCYHFRVALFFTLCLCLCMIFSKPKGGAGHPTNHVAIMGEKPAHIVAPPQMTSLVIGALPLSLSLSLYLYDICSGAESQPILSSRLRWRH